ncbi:MAG: ribonuclease III [Parachlamydia sp.]|nr:ribonuclease III [Parachlamydia sp.]
MQTIHELKKAMPLIEERLHYAFKDRSLLALAFVHRSYVNENREVKEHNERLEFLGDSILGLVMSDYLYRMLPETPEGDLSFLRSRLVEAPSCVNYVQKLQVEGFLLLGKGERMDGRGRGSILADLFEALVGAIYLDGGLEESERFVFGHFAGEIEAILKMPINNWKAMLQDYCQKHFQQTPFYEVVSESGPDHSKRYRVRVCISDGQELGQGEGNSKKMAQQAAAEDAMRKYGD